MAFRIEIAAALAALIQIRAPARPTSYGHEVPLYYFNVYNDDTTLDYEGRELADDHAAEAFAIEAARSLAAESVLHGHLTVHHRVEYVDADQNRVGAIRFDEAVEIRR